MSPERLLRHFDQIAEAPDAVPQLRRFILDLAVKGKLVEQDPADEPASELMKRIKAEKERLIEAGEIPQEKPLSPIEEAGIPFDTPQNWSWTRLRYVASYIQRGKSPQYAGGEGRPVISQKCVQWDGLHLEWAKAITPESLESYEPIRFLRDGDLLWNSTGTGTIGRVVRVGKSDEGLVCDSHVTVVRCLLVDERFICIWLRSDHVYGTIEERAAGATNQVELTAGIANNQITPISPLPEQHRIVAKVDELMPLCDELEAAQQKRERRRDRLVAATLNGLNNGDANSETHERPGFEESARFYFNHLPRLTTRPEHIQQLRQTILNLAVRGKLIPQDPNDEPASELLNRHVAQRARLAKAGEVHQHKSLAPVESSEIQFRIPQGWAATRIGIVGNTRDSSIVDGPFGSSVNTKRDYRESGVPVTRMSNIAPFEYKRENLMFIAEEKFSILRRHNIIPGDVLLGKVGSIGNAAIYPKDMQEGMLATTGVARFRVGEVIQDRYLCILLNAIAPELRAIASQAVQPFLSMKTINNLPILLPPLTEQHRIVAKVDELMALCDELEARLIDTAATRRQLLEATVNEAIAS